MRFTVLIAAAMLALTGCGNPATEPTAPAAPSAASTTDTPATPTDLTSGFRASAGNAAWVGEVASVEQDGQGVRVRTTTAEVTDTDSIAMCEAARKFADAQKLDYVSVTVRTSEDSSVGTFNKLRNDTECTAV